VWLRVKGGVYSSPLKETALKLPGRLELPSKVAPRGPTSPPPPPSPSGVGVPNHLTPGRYHYQKPKWRVINRGESEARERKEGET